MRESFIFYKSFYESIKELDLKDQVQIYNAIFSYQFENKEIELTGVCKSIFTLIIPQLEANNKRYVNGCKGGAPKGNTNASKKQPKNNLKTTKNNLNLTEKQPNDNVNENDNVNRNKFIKPTIEEIQNYCNERNNGINAEAFHDFYESKNWYVGKNKMKDWKASVRTWERRSEISKPKTQNNVIEPKWLDKEIEEEKATEKEIKEIEERLNRR